MTSPPATNPCTIISLIDHHQRFSPLDHCLGRLPRAQIKGWVLAMLASLGVAACAWLWSRETAPLILTPPVPRRRPDGCMRNPSDQRRGTKQMTQLHAQPYDISANGFYFESLDEFNNNAIKNRNDYGDLVEEYEIQFIDGNAIDCALADAVAINQANIGQYFDIVEAWSHDDKLRYILAVGECGYAFDLEKDDPNELDVDVYHLNSLHELAEQFVEDGIMGDVPDALQTYFDYDALARDLGIDYSETAIAGQTIIFRCS
ncbi:MAG: antirestriction protein ArdA [Sulfitobacter sp.]